mmetsp:Transcript_7686/g.18307  ORF Transcript_7686/g.18307 Transcript_7686/m.18307 type:complete len:220 (+) Transcript_7686:437-1096(+)
MAGPHQARKPTHPPFPRRNLSSAPAQSQAFSPECSKPHWTLALVTRLSSPFPLCFPSTTIPERGAAPARHPAPASCSEPHFGKPLSSMHQLPPVRELSQVPPAPRPPRFLPTPAALHLPACVRVNASSKPSPRPSWRESNPPDNLPEDPNCCCWSEPPGAKAPHQHPRRPRPPRLQSRRPRPKPPRTAGWMRMWRRHGSSPSEAPTARPARHRMYWPLM